MAERIKIPFKTSVVVELLAPVDVVNQTTLNFSDNGAICFLKVFEEARSKEVLTFLEAVGQSVWSVTNPGNFVAGDVVELDQDDGTVHESNVTSINVSAGTINTDTPTTVAAAAGSRIRVRLGAQITMTEFGTPRLDEIETWGFRGTIPSDHPGLLVDLDVDVEITFAGTGVVGAGLDLVEVICGVIKNVQDCEDT